MPKKKGGSFFLQTSNEENFFYTYWTRRKNRGNIRVHRKELRTFHTRTTRNSEAAETAAPYVAAF